MESLRGLWNAIEAFADSLASVSFGALFVATLFHFANLTLRTRAWTTILQAAYPRQRVRWPDVFGAYCAGVGVNGIVPARGGDAIMTAPTARPSPTSPWATPTGASPPAWICAGSASRGSR